MSLTRKRLLAVGLYVFGFGGLMALGLAFERAQDSMAWAEARCSRKLGVSHMAYRECVVAEQGTPGWKLALPGLAASAVGAGIASLSLIPRGSAAPDQEVSVD